MSATWTQAESIEWCRRAEAVAPACGYHVALTGGCLYKDGERKDLDVVFYEIRGKRLADVFDLLDALSKANLIIGRGPADAPDTFVIKTNEPNTGRGIDLLFPEADGDYDDSHRGLGEQAKIDVDDDIIF